MHKRLFLMFLFFLPVPALAHPGHGALEIHWHLDDIAWAALGAFILVGIFLLLRAALKK